METVIMYEGQSDENGRKSRFKTQFSICKIHPIILNATKIQFCHKII